MGGGGGGGIRVRPTFELAGTRQLLRLRTVTIDAMVGDGILTPPGGNERN
jgi:hypothetical protein